jgi:hypothetical protein
MILDDQAGNQGNPLGVAGNAGESGGQTSGASGGGAEADDTNLVVNAVVVETQRAARVALYQNKNTKLNFDKFKFRQEI